MRAIPSMRISKTNGLNFHRHHCSSLITNCFKSILIRDSLEARLKNKEVFGQSI